MGGCRSTVSSGGCSTVCGNTLTGRPFPEIMKEHELTGTFVSACAVCNCWKHTIDWQILFEFRIMINFWSDVVTQKWHLPPTTLHSKVKKNVRGTSCLEEILKYNKLKSIDYHLLLRTGLMVATVVCQWCANVHHVSKGIHVQKLFQTKNRMQP